MLVEPFAEELKQKAKRYRVNPKFLLFAIAALYKNPHCTETDIAQPYFDALVADLKEAENKGPRVNIKTGEPYHSEMTPIKGSFLEKYFTVEDLEKIKAFLPANEAVLHLHSIAYNHLHADLHRMRRRWKEAGYKVDLPNEPDAVQIIRLLCPDLIEHYKQIVGIFKHFDLLTN